MTVDDSASENYFRASFSDVEEVASMTVADNSEKSNTFVLTGTPSKPTKKATVNVEMNNYGTAATGKITINVVGAKPEIEGDDAVDMDANATTTLDLTLSNADKLNDKVKWKVESKPGNGVSAKITGDASGATVTIKSSKKSTSGSTTFTVSATDSVTKKASDKKTITVNVTADTEAVAEVLENTVAKGEVLDDEEETTATGEGKVLMGVQRTAGSLTAAQRTFIEQQGYIVAAVLPEIEVEGADGQYEFEVDELEEDAATGAELVWFAFASKPTTDDEIVDFADLATGKETTVIPESRTLIVAPWLNVGTKYAPVIAVKAEAGEAGKTESELKE